jgi:site-specific recombinase XerD
MPNLPMYRSEMRATLYVTLVYLTVALLPMIHRLRSWTDWLEATSKRPKTIRQYRYWLLRFTADTLIDPWEATEADLVAYIGQMPKTGTGRHAFLQAMSAYWRWAESLAGRNPTTRLTIRRPKTPPAPHIAPDVLRAIIREAFRHEPRRGWTIVLMFATGVRVGSLVAIRPEDVNLADGLLWIREAKAGRSYELPLEKLALSAASWLTQDARDADRETLVGVGDEQVRNWLREARIKAGVPDRVWPHLLRHSFATELARVTDPETWRVAMNHADLSNFQRYVHTEAERVRDALSQVRL